MTKDKKISIFVSDSTKKYKIIWKLNKIKGNKINFSVFFYYKKQNNINFMMTKIKKVYIVSLY